MSEMNPGLTRRLTRPSMQVKDHLPINVPWTNRNPTPDELSNDPLVLVNDTISGKGGIVLMYMSAMVQQYSRIYWVPLTTIVPRIIPKSDRVIALSNGVMEVGRTAVLFEDLYGPNNEDAYSILAEKINTAIDDVTAEEMINAAYRMQTDEECDEEAPMVGDLC